MLSVPTQKSERSCTGVLEVVFFVCTKPEE
jgi:hypothetical protein